MVGGLTCVRAGRAGRFGRKGVVISFSKNRRDYRTLQSVSKFTGITLHEIDANTFKDTEQAIDTEHIEAPTEQELAEIEKEQEAQNADSGAPPQAGEGEQQAGEGEQPPPQSE